MPLLLLEAIKIAMKIQQLPGKLPEKAIFLRKIIEVYQREHILLIIGIGMPFRKAIVALFADPAQGVGLSFLRVKQTILRAIGKNVCGESQASEVFGAVEKHFVVF